MFRIKKATRLRNKEDNNQPQATSSMNPMYLLFGLFTFRAQALMNMMSSKEATSTANEKNSFVHLRRSAVLNPRNQR